MRIFIKLIIINLLLLSSMGLFASTDTLTITPTNNTSIDITTTQTNLALGTISIANTSTGSTKQFQMSVTSTNGGLKNTNAATKSGAAGTYLKGYTIAFAMTTGTGLTNSGPLNTATIGTTKTLFYVGTEGGSTTGLFGNLSISLTGTPAAQLYSGTYTDTITFEAKNLTTTSNPLKTATLVLTAAVINDTITLTVTPTASASNLPLTTTQTALNVGSVNVTANCQNGYLLKVASTNSGSLVNTSVGSPGVNDKITYGLAFGASAMTLSSTATTFSTVSTATMYSSSTLLGNLNMSYTGVPNSSRTAGSYQDVLTFTLQSQ